MLLMAVELVTMAVRFYMLKKRGEKRYIIGSKSCYTPMICNLNDCD